MKIKINVDAKNQCITVRSMGKSAVYSGGWFDAKVSDIVQDFLDNVVGR